MSFSADRLLRFSSVAAGGSGHWHIYYGQYYVGSIQHLSGAWCVRHHGIPLGRFAELEAAQGVVAEWYYGPTSAAETCDAAPSAAWPAGENTPITMYGKNFALACPQRTRESGLP